MKMNTTILYVMRHGETTDNRDDLTSGHVDPELTEEGSRQAAAVREKLSHIHFDEVYSSDLKRAANTAAIVYGEEVPSHHRLFELRERNYGSIDGTPNENLNNLRAKHQPKYESLSEEDRWKYMHAEDMESDHEVAERFVKGIKKIAEDNLGKTVLIAAHGGVMRILLISLGYGTTREIPFGGSFENGGFVKLIYDGTSLKVDEVEGLIKRKTQ